MKMSQMHIWKYIMQKVEAKPCFFAVNALNPSDVGAMVLLPLATSRDWRLKTYDHYRYKKWKRTASSMPGIIKNLKRKRGKEQSKKPTQLQL